MTTGITIDGIDYNIRLKYETLRRAFEINEGQNSGNALDGTLIRDIIGTRYNYEIDIEPDPADPSDYDAFYDLISSPVAAHEVSFPYGQETITFRAVIQSGTDTYYGVVGCKRRWGGLSIVFQALTPQRKSNE